VYVDSALRVVFTKEMPAVAVAGVAMRRRAVVLKPLPSSVGLWPLLLSSSSRSHWPGMRSPRSSYVLCPPRPTLYSCTVGNFLQGSTIPLLPQRA
jgi:hypothetical protein